MAKEAPIGEVLLTDVRASFLDLYERGKPMRDQETGEMREGKFKGNFLIDKKRYAKEIKPLLEKVKDEVLTKKYGADRTKWPKYKPDKVYVRDGDLEDWDGYQGMVYVSAGNTDSVQLISRRKNDKGEWIEAAKGEIYAGCYVNILIQVWAQDHKDYGKRLNARLKVVQFNRKGDAFSSSGPVDVNEKFAAIAEDEGESMGQIEDHSDDEDDTGLI